MKNFLNVFLGDTVISANFSGTYWTQMPSVAAENLAPTNMSQHYISFEVKSTQAGLFRLTNNAKWHFYTG